MKTTDQIIHEARGLCWHESKKNQWYELYKNEARVPCEKCGALAFHHNNPSYTSSWADFGPMLEEMMKKEWWDEFAYEKWYGVRVTRGDILHPKAGSTAIAEFLKERCKYGERKEEGK